MFTLFKGQIRIFFQIFKSNLFLFRQRMFTAYKNPTVCVVNAQTGEKYDFVDNARENRRYEIDL